MCCAPAGEHPLRRAAGVDLVELAQESTLQTIAEISAAFVGFSLVGGLLGTQSSDHYRFYSIRDVAEVGLSCLLGALIPSAVHAFGLAADVTWRLASGTFLVLWGAVSPARYVLALVLLLSFAGVSFIAAVFHGRTAPPTA